MPKKHVLIVGGGFGGIKAALELSQDPDFEITLLSDRPTFRYYPTLFHAATGGAVAQSSIPLSTIFAKKNVRLEQGRADVCDPTKHTISSGTSTYQYDILILALGVVTNFFGIKGLEEFSFGIKSLEEAEELKHHLHQQLLDERKPDFNYIIVGGGPTGIELAGALPSYLRHIMSKHNISDRTIHVDLVEAAPKLIARMPTTMSDVVARRLHKLGIRLYLGKTVNGETADALMIDNKPLTSHTVIWTAGVTNNPFFKANNFTMSEHGKVKVDPYLQAQPDIFVLGDNADTLYSGMAQTALYDAKFVANNLKLSLKGKRPKTYKPKKPIYVIPAGPHWAATLWGNLKFYGKIGWIIRELADLQAFRDLEPLSRASTQWFNEFTEQEECPVCSQAL